MSLGAILEAIQNAAGEQVAEIEAQATAEVLRIEASADAALADIREAAQHDASVAAAGERSRVIHRARLQAMQAAGEARHALVQRALVQAGERLQVYRKSPDYTALFQRLLQEALAVLLGSLDEGEVPVVRVDPRDRALLEVILASTGQLVTVIEEDFDWGGVQVTSADGRVVVDNTLRARMARAAPYLHRYLPRMLEDNAG